MQRPWKMFSTLGTHVYLDLCCVLSRDGKIAETGHPCYHGDPIYYQITNLNAETGRNERLRVCRGLGKRSAPLELTFTSTSAASLAEMVR